MERKTKPEILFVGAVIYETCNNRIYSIMKIERVTKTMAISGSARFKLEISSNGFVRRVGASTWDTSSYRIETEDLKHIFNRQRICNYIKEALKNIDSLTLDQLQRIQSIIQEIQ